MNIDKNYFSERLAAGEDIDAIGQDIAKAMNEALEEYRAAEEAKKAAAAKAENESAKRDIVREMVELIQEYAILEGMDGDELETSEEDIEQLVELGVADTDGDIEVLVIIAGALITGEAAAETVGIDGSVQ